VRAGSAATWQKRVAPALLETIKGLARAGS
jgi:hypothetical protein